MDTRDEMDVTHTIGILAFDGAEELDFVGPWEVFTASAMLREQAGEDLDRVVLIAEKTNPVRCAKGLRVLPDATFADHPHLDVGLYRAAREHAEARRIPRCSAGWLAPPLPPSGWRACVPARAGRESLPANRLLGTLTISASDPARHPPLHVTGSP